MGHKVSVVHGVKSDDFFKPGNAINEIWLGRLEIISRLPFGDSDMGQAGWHSGGFPKIPWHNFIIPLKRRAEQKSVGEEAINEATMQLSFPVVILLCVVVVACALPVMVRRQTPSSWDRICKTDLSRRDNGLGGHGYAVRACIATISLAMGLVVLAPLVMDARGSGLGQASGSVMAFVSVVMGVIVILGVRAVFSLWMDWRRISRQEDDDHGDDVEASSALVDENLPLVFLSVLQRQRLA